jgi:hypothetical protein
LEFIVTRSMLRHHRRNPSGNQSRRHEDCLGNGGLTQAAR